GGSRLLAPPSSTSCISDLSYTPALTAIAPGGTCLTDDTQCNSAVQYSSSSVLLPVYTPNCFESGGSLSHFEDMCSTTQFTPSNTNSCPTNTTMPRYTNFNIQYFLMSQIDW